MYQIYCDEDYSGADRLRPDFCRMLQAAREGKFQILLCKSQSRFTRDMELVEKYLHGLFPLWGVRFIAVADHVDTGVKGGKKARQINGLINEWYLEDLSENIRMVFDLKRRSGQYIGGVPLYGYQKDPADRHRLVIEPEAAQIVRQIFQWSWEGRGRQAIAQMLNDRGVPNPTAYKRERGWLRGPPEGGGGTLWNKTTVWRILRNEMYAGVMLQGRRRKASYKSKTLLPVPEEEWFRVEGTHEAIVDRALFEAVQRGLELRARSDGRGEVHPLSGLVKCLDCGAALGKTSNGKKGDAQVCYLRCQRYASSGQEKRCTRHAVRLDALVALVSERLRHYVQENCLPEGRMKLPMPRDARREALEGERRRRAARLDKAGRTWRQLYRDRAAGILSTEQFMALNQEVLEEKSRLERRLAELDRELAELPPPAGRAEVLKRVRDLLKLETVPRALFAALIETVEVGERDPETGAQEVRITWRF